MNRELTNDPPRGTQDAPRLITKNNISIPVVLRLALRVQRCSEVR